MKVSKSKKYPLRCNGSVWFASEADCDEAETDRVIFRSEKEIVFEFKMNDEDGVLWTYNVTLIQQDGPHYSGKWEARANGDSEMGKADCSIYWNDEGYLLFGHWFEGGYDSWWFSKLKPIHHFENQE